MTTWKEQTVNEKAEYNITKNGYVDSFEPLFWQECPIDLDGWVDHVRNVICEDINEDDIDDDEVIAKATVHEVSYINDRGEADVRYEARYDRVV